jgi:hypothetical protein
VSSSIRANPIWLNKFFLKMQTESPETIVISESDRKELWKTVSNLEKKAVYKV